MKREIVIDLYIFDEHGLIAAVERDENDMYEKNVLSGGILILPHGKHPVEHIRQYLEGKSIKDQMIEMLPAIYHNTFDSTPDEEFLVLSFKAVIKHQEIITGDDQNRKFSWMTMEEFVSHPKLMPEFKRSNVQQIFEGKPLFYKGYYKESDGSYDVLNWQVF